MVKFLALQALFCSLLFAASATLSAQALSADASAARSLFSDESKFIDEKGFVKTKEIVGLLQENGLFDAASFSSSSLNLKFTTSDEISPAIFVKALNFSLDMMGTNIARVNEFSNLSPISYSLIALKSGGIDPVLLAQALDASGFGILEFSRQSGNLVISLEAKDAQIKSGEPIFGEEFVLPRSAGAYFLNTGGASELEIVSNEPSRWVPLVRIYDKNLEQIVSFEVHKAMHKYDLQLPSDAKYVLISDNIDINNIKNDISVKLSK